MLLPLPLQNNIAGTGMARQIRKKSETGVYHVMLRGINRQDIFEDDEVFFPMMCFVTRMRYVYQNTVKSGLTSSTGDNVFPQHDSWRFESSDDSESGEEQTEYQLIL